MTTRSKAPTSSTTQIFKFTQHGEYQIGQIIDNVICALPGQKEVGNVAETDRIMRKGTHGEQELGYAVANGQVISNGLFEGGSIGWVEDDGTVVQAGLILGEEDVGRVEGPQRLAGAAALLLLFLPKDAEDEKRLMRRG